MTVKMNDKPWENEPDRVEFESHGFPCLIRRVPSTKALCGYVAVPPTHPYFGKGTGAVDVDVHGGITFSGKCGGDICHVPKEGEPDNVWWFGFDCAHCFDLIPSFYELRQSGGPLHKLQEEFSKLYSHESRFKETYRDINFVKSECESLAEQLRKVA